MVKVIEKQEVHFRIQIYDLKKNKSKIVKLENHGDFTAVDLKAFIESCFKNKSITDKYLKKNRVKLS